MQSNFFLRHYLVLVYRHYRSVMYGVIRSYYVFFFFFFQAEDGIRDIGVTGVQTCALPISNFRVVLRPEEGPLYLALAQYYTEVGNSKKAADLTQKGKSLLADTPAKP